MRYVNTLWSVTESERSISAPVAYKIVDDTAVKFVAQTLTAAQNALAEKPKPAAVESIKVAAKPTKTEYTVGDTFSADGLKVVKVMSDKTEPGKKPGVQKPAGQQNVCPRPVPRWLAWPVCVPKCAPKRQVREHRDANRPICVPKCARSSFRRALKNANSR